ncbi:MAG: substrate-binding domain-containing protein, partial [Armatimonadetes bacterium]|nr:substrate-binding domain-containing protein [Armatimonadota bacterium]
MKKFLAAAVVFFFLAAATGCGGGQGGRQTGGQETGAGERQEGGKKVFLNGAGASFPYPLYSRWIDAYGKIEKNVQINYQSIGSGAGIRQFTEQVIDFGGTDAP